MSETVGSAPPAEVAASFDNADLRDRLASDNYLVRDAAQAELSAIYRRSFGDGPADQVAPSSGHAGQNVYSGGDVDSDVPPSGEFYSLHPVLNAEPAFAEAFRDWCHVAGFGIQDAAALGGEVVRLSEAERDQPDHIRQSKSDLVLADLASTDEGQQVLHYARLGWARLEARNPGLADLLNELGASTDPTFIRKLAVATARRG